MDALGYTEFPVPPGLRDVVRCIWALEGAGNAGGDAEPVLPDGCMELVLNHAIPFEELEGDTWRPQPRAFLYGQITRAIHLRPAGRCGMIGVRFEPAGAHALFRTDMGRFTDGKVPLPDLLADPGRFAPVMAPDVPTAERVERAIAALQDLSAAGVAVERAVTDLVRRISTDEEASVGALKSGVPLSPRQIERRFLTVVGLRPKVFARIIRLRRFIDRAREAPHGPLAAWAHAAGYYDQAHFNREFKAFTGRAPKDYFGQELVLPDHFSGLP